jgi:hypothetical protein
LLLVSLLTSRSQVKTFRRLIVSVIDAGTEVFSDGRGKKDDGSMEVDEIGIVLGD